MVVTSPRPWPSRGPLGAFLAFLVLGLAGCLATEDKRVTVRRDRGQLMEDERLARLDYEELLEEQQLREDDLILPPDLVRSEARYELARRQIAATLRTIPNDPFAAYERDRRAVLYRQWADVGQSPPEPEPEPAAEPEPEVSEEEWEAEQEKDDDPWGDW